MSRETNARKPSMAKTPSRGRSRPLRRLGVAVVTTLAIGLFVAALVVLATLAAIMVGPLLVQLGEFMNGR